MSGRMSVTWRLVALLAMAGGLLGCQSYPTYLYQPRPASHSVQVDQQPLRVMATVLGVREPGGNQVPYLEARLRVDNDTASAAQLDPATLSVVSADLQRLDVLDVEPAGVLTVEPGNVGLLRVRFALPAKPDDGPDLSGLSLRWAIEAGGQTHRGDVAFQGRQPIRRAYYPYDPFYDDDYWYYRPGPGWRHGLYYYHGWYP